jgi:aldehyde dehydrogenase (NAD+)
MTISADASVPIEHTGRILVGGEWVTPSSGSTITVIDSHTEQAYFTVAEAQPADIDRAVAAARDAFDHGPWPRLTHAQRAAYLRALGEEVVKRSGAIQQMWPREAGVLASIADGAAHEARHTFDYYADLAAEGRRTHGAHHRGHHHHYVEPSTTSRPRPQPGLHRLGHRRSRQPRRATGTHRRRR